MLINTCKYSQSQKITCDCEYSQPPEIVNTMPVKFKVPNLRSESLGNALAAKVQSLVQPGGGKVFPRPILASSSSEPRPSLVGAKVRASSEPGHPKVRRESRQPNRHLKPLTHCIAPHCYCVALSSASRCTGSRCPVLPWAPMTPRARQAERIPFRMHQAQWPRGGMSTTKPAEPMAP